VSPFSTSPEECLYSTLWNLNSSSRRCYDCVRKELQNLFHLNFCLQIRQLITACGNTAREGVQNTYHWSGWTETATENGSSGPSWITSSLASLIAADQWCVFRTTLLKYFPHAVINWIQIFVRQLRLDISGVSLSIFQVSQGSVDTLFMWAGKHLHDFFGKFIHETIY